MYITDRRDRAAMSGSTSASNTDWVSSPAPARLRDELDHPGCRQLAFEQGGTAVFQGHAEFRLPNAMLTRLYNVDDPATLTPAAFAVTGAGRATTSVVSIPPASRS